MSSLDQNCLYSRKKQCGGVWGRKGGQDYIPFSMDIPFHSDSVPFSLSNCLPLRQIPLAKYSMGVQPRRLGSIKPPPNLLQIIFLGKNCHFHKYLAKLGVGPSGILPQVFTTCNSVFIIVYVHII